MRSKAIALLVDFFERERLKDEWFIACVCLLDRLAAARKFLVLAPGDFGLELSAIVMLILQQSSFVAELDDFGNFAIKDIAFRFVQISTTDWHREWWPRTCLAELAVCSAVSYRVCVPTPLDLAQCVATDVCRAVRAASPAWSGLTSIQLPAPRPKFAAPTSIFTAVASYLVELGLAHVHEEVYAQGMRPAVLSLAALHLALHAFEPSPIAVQFLEITRGELLDQHE